MLLEVGLKSSFFDIFWLYRAMHEEGRTFGLVFVEANSKCSLTSLRLPENVCKAPPVSLISVRSFRSPASFQRASLSLSLSLS